MTTATATRLAPLTCPIILAASMLVPLASARAQPALAGVCDLAEAPDVSEHPAPVDCAQSTDTGYMSGAPFQISVVHIDGLPVEVSTANAYWVMREAAAADGVDIHINSGFRTMSEQQYVYDCFINCNCNMCNQAAKPGYSNHQSGHALDLNTAKAGVYNWLAAHGGAYGFKETVAGEPWHWEWWGGGPGGGICDITSPPTGYVDGATCDAISGWAQDPDSPDAAIEVHVYFNGPAGDPAAIGVPIVADQHRDDLCMAIGSCNHGYTLAIPPSLRDNAPHSVHVYGIDLEGKSNPQLGSSPASFTCAPPWLPPGVRRHIADPNVLGAWKFDMFWQLVHLDEATLLAIPEWNAIDPAPQLIVADDGSPEVWLKDGAVRRHVPGPKAAEAWGFDLGAVVSTPAAELYAIPLGTPVWDEPVLVQGPGPEVYQLDDLQCPPGSSDPACPQEPETSSTTDETSGSPTPTTGDDEPGAPTPTGGSSETGEALTSAGPDSGGQAAEDAGCACRTDDSPALPRLGLGLLVLGLLARRRAR